MAGTLYLCATPIGNLDIPGGEDIKRSGSDRSRRYQKQYQASESF